MHFAIFSYVNDNVTCQVHNFVNICFCIQVKVVVVHLSTLSIAHKYNPNESERNLTPPSFSTSSLEYFT